MIEWINKRATLDDIVKRFKKIEKLINKANKELELIRVALNLR